jgi:hypothetical protein
MLGPRISLTGSAPLPLPPPRPPVPYSIPSYQPSMAPAFQGPVTLPPPSAEVIARQTPRAPVKYDPVSP